MSQQFRNDPQRRERIFFGAINEERHFGMQYRSAVLKAAAVGVLLALFGSPPHSAAAQRPLRILCTTFPMYLITANIVAGRPLVDNALMIPPDLGCPHDYALTPQDLRKLARADILVINGLGMETFMDALMKSAMPGLKVVDGSQGVAPVIEDAGAGHDRHDHRAAGQIHTDPNPHLFASPRMAALIAVAIARQLSAIDDAHSGLYQANGQVYAEKMNRLADDFAALGRQLRNNRIVTQHGVFDYLARDMGLEVVAVVQAHAGQDPSAAEMLSIVQSARRERAGAVFTEPQYPDKIGWSIAREAGIAAEVLDPVASGPEKAPLDYYERVMRANLIILEKTLGAR
jgi:ABC-type Zn uptake system ZnuABC Zn-binding protein ZnuA